MAKLPWPLALPLLALLWQCDSNTLFVVAAGVAVSFVLLLLYAAGQHLGLIMSTHDDKE